MPRTSSVTVTDQFCGAGGSSIGATAAGAELRLALNHWPLAIQTHNTNFPDAAHDCTDVSACDPRRYPATDILITSPECTNHSLAKGKMRKWRAQLNMFGRLELDPAEERSRATMWDVCRFAEAHRYSIVIVENVVEARWWEPFDAWLQAMSLLGYNHRIVYLNSMFAHPTPQSRDRMYVVFWRKSLRAPNLDIRPCAYCPHCEQDVASVQSWKNPRRLWGKCGQQYVYRCPDCAGEVSPYYYCAANAIDWSLPAPRIGDRRRPLKETTLRRIAIGLRKFGHQMQPLVIETQWSHATGDRSSGTDEPLPTQTGQLGRGLVMPPFLVDMTRTRGVGAPVDGPYPTQTGSEVFGLVAPPAFLTSYNSTSDGSSLSEPLPTQDTRDRHALVLAPFVVSYYTRLAGQQAAVSGVDDALPTMPGRAVHYLAQPGETLKVEDCGFRMLQPHEIGRAMAFPDDYKVLGNQRQQVKQYGNAVTPPVMRLLMERCLEILG